MANPDNLDPFLNSNLVGSAGTICRRIDSLIALGFNYFMVSCATPGTPVELRRRMMTRFAELKWAARDPAPGSRVVNFSRTGEKRFAALFCNGE